MIAGDPVPGQRQASSKTKSAKDKDIGDRDDRACTSETQKLLEVLAATLRSLLSDGDGHEGGSADCTFEVYSYGATEVGLLDVCTIQARARQIRAIQIRV